MDRLVLKASGSSPAIDFDFDAGRFSVVGESYPENVTSYFGPVMERLRAYLDNKTDGDVAFTFALTYFNSGTARVLAEILDALEEAAVAGVSVAIEWRHDPDDEMMRELGEEFAEDLNKVTFNLVAIERQP